MERPTLLQTGVKLILFWLAAAATYFVVPIVTPFKIGTMPLTEFSTFIPFLSWTVVIYFTLFLHQIVSFYTARSRVELRHLFRAYLWGIVITSTIYFFLPVVHEMPHILTQATSLFDRLVVFMQGVDVPVNLFPSGHVFFSALPSVFAFTLGRKRMGMLLGIWSVLILLSTLTLRQHGLIDAFTGLILALVIGIVFGARALRSFKQEATMSRWPNG